MFLHWILLLRFAHVYIGTPDIIQMLDYLSVIIMGSQ